MVEIHNSRYINKTSSRQEVQVIGVYSTWDKLMEAFQRCERLSGFKATRTEYLDYYTYREDRDYWPSAVVAESMNWQEFKEWSEKRWLEIRADEEDNEFRTPSELKWNSGLTQVEIKGLEKAFGFEFPDDYKKMLLVMNGADEIPINPNSTSGRIIYRYPEDMEEVEFKGLVQEINQFIDYVKKTLKEEGYDAETVVGFIPLCGPQALAVFQDKSLTPVISIHQGYDVVVVGRTIMDHWAKFIDSQ